MIPRIIFRENIKVILRSLCLAALLIALGMLLSYVEYFFPDGDIYSYDISSIKTDAYYKMNIDRLHAYVSDTSKGGCFYLTEAWDHGERVFIALQIDPLDMEEADILYHSQDQENRRPLKGTCYVYDLHNFEGTAETFESFCDSYGLNPGSVRSICAQYIPLKHRFNAKTIIALFCVSLIGLQAFPILIDIILVGRKDYTAACLKYYIRKDQILSDAQNGIRVGDFVLGQEYLIYVKLCIGLIVPYQYIRSVNTGKGPTRINGAIPKVYIVVVNDFSGGVWTITVRTQEEAQQLRKLITQKMEPYQ